ncbi:hypothetical protein IJG26_02260 [Candidatus Saccharibacteria bacterium]|nr:hypothetical protein [Candidatus Saccharibacteria bacterium]MBR0415682.1 hypothetical protein [Candidatus Saccharibacteria bacterium]
MKRKEVIQRLLGEGTVRKVSVCKKYLKTLKFRNFYSYNHTIVDKFNIFFLKKKNVFCGYYDLDPERGGKILAHVIPRNAKNNDAAELGFFDVGDEKYTRVGGTNAWSWQQGSRLRWSNREENSIFYNTVRGDKYVTVKKNLDSGKESFYNVPFYDISPNEKYGVSINFDRLQRLRPGYGYSCFEDETKSDNAPMDDGLFLFNLGSNKKSLIISLKDLAKDVDKNLQFEHYLNHISFSPDSKKIMFFHLWNEKRGRFDWQNRLFVYNIDSGKSKVLESEAVVSHYTWVDNKRLLITCGTERGEEYRTYNVESGAYKIVDYEQLKKDGHPVMIEKDKVFCSDTYPNKKSMQELFLFNLLSKKYTQIAKMYSDPLLYGEKRCDLHPKYAKSSNSIFVDSTFSDHCRKIIRIELSE